MEGDIMHMPYKKQKRAMMMSIEISKLKVWHVNHKGKAVPSRKTDVDCK
jgi:hypothetical protein